MSKQSPRLPRLRLTAVLFVMGLLAIGAVTAVSRQRAMGAGEKKASPTVSAPAYVTVKFAGQDVQVNSQTGQIKPLTPEEARTLAAGLKQMVNKSTEDLVQTQHGDGSVSVDMGDRFRNVTVARVNKNGSIAQSCIDNPRAASAFFGFDPKLIEGPPDPRSSVNRRNPAARVRQR